MKNFIFLILLFSSLLFATEKKFFIMGNIHENCTLLDSLTNKQFPYLTCFKMETKAYFTIAMNENAWAKEINRCSQESRMAWRKEFGRSWTGMLHCIRFLREM